MGKIMFVLFLVKLLFFQKSQAKSTLFICVQTDFNYTEGSLFETNLNLLLNDLVAKAISLNFYQSDVGNLSNKVYGLFQCRYDISLFDCNICVEDSIQKIVKECHLYGEAILWPDNTDSLCMVRYANRNISSLSNTSPGILHHNQNNISYFPESLPILPILKSTLKDVNGNASIAMPHFASIVTNWTQYLRLYAYAQCTPIIDRFECYDCLDKALSNLTDCCSRTKGVKVLFPSCELRFETGPFLVHATVPPLSADPPAHTRSNILPGTKRRSAYIVWIVTVSVILLLLIAAIVFALSRRKMSKKLKQEKSNVQFKLEDSLLLEFNSIRSATDNFSDANRLGRHGSDNGTILYKGLLPDGQEIVVKKLDKGGRDAELEFDNEVMLSGNLQHKNLVKVLGYCVEQDIKFLVYEFLPNGNLQNLLNDPVKRANLDWETRYHIITGFARGLLYLHEDSQLRVIHRDLKPSNILLDAQMDTKISNFKTASLFQRDQTRGDTKVVGTYGYMPQEYVQYGHSSIKSDIFSYGVILLEIITGYVITGFSYTENEECLLTYVWRNWCNGAALDVVDQAIPAIQKQRHANQIKRCIKIALLCVQEDLTQRPTMSMVVLMLKSDIIYIANPIKPTYLILNSGDHHSNSKH